jgi:hypothetical protein
MPDCNLFCGGPGDSVIEDLTPVPPGIGRHAVIGDKIKNMAQATDLNELTKIIEALVRKVVREELANFARENGMIYLSPDSPLYEDMEKILQRRLNEEPKLYDHAEVWGDE